MEQQKSNNSSLKAIIAILALLLTTSLVWVYKISADSEKTIVVLKSEMTEKETVMKQLEDLKTTYDRAIAEKTELSEELIKEREKVINLMLDLKKSKGDVASMNKYKAEFLTLQKKMQTIIAENKNLKKENQSLALERDSTKTILTQSKKANTELISKNEELEKTVEKAAKLSVLNVKGIAYKVKSSGKEIETDKASRADMFKISFTIAQNKVAIAQNKSYFIQIIDGKNNVIGDKKTETFGDKILTYSFISNVKYENKTTEIIQNLYGKDFVSGIYSVNIFDKDELVAKGSFTLR